MSKLALLNAYCLIRLRKVELQLAAALLPDAVGEEQVVAPQVRQPTLGVELEVRRKALRYADGGALPPSHLTRIAEVRRPVVRKSPGNAPNRDSVLVELRSALPRLRGQFGVQALALFGSVARGTARATSDIDLLVDLTRDDLSLFDLLHMEQELASLLGHPVHITERAALPPPVRLRVEREAVVV